MGISLAGGIKACELPGYRRPRQTRYFKTEFCRTYTFCLPTVKQFLTSTLVKLRILHKIYCRGLVRISNLRDCKGPDDKNGTDSSNLLK